jgi:hypothetical protein
MYLSRAGWAPPHLHNGWAKHSSVPDLRFPLNFRESTPEKRRGGGVSENKCLG